MRKSFKKIIPLIDVSIDQKSLEIIKKGIDRVIKSNSYVLGKNLSLFETQFSKFLGSSETIGVANGTDALSLSLRALGIGKGDKVLTVAFTSPFTSISILEEGAEPVYCDVDPKTWTIDVDDCAKKIDKKVKAIMPVHIYGNPCNLDEIKKFAKSYDLKIIEDACQAHLAKYSGRNVGTIGDMGAFSFYPTKNLGALGDGGIITTNSRRLAKLVRILRHGGQTKRFWHVYPGKNSRLDEIQAMILSIKLKKLKLNNFSREKIVNRYKKYLDDLPLTFQEVFKNAKSANHLCVIQVEKQKEFKQFLANKGIETGVYYPHPVHKQPTFSSYNKHKLPITENLTKKLVAIPLYPTLTTRDQEFVISNIRSFFKR